MTNSKGIKLLAAVAVLAVMFAGAAVIFSDNGDVDAAGSDITYISGTLTGTQEFIPGNTVVINNDLVIPKDMKLTINGAKLTVNEGVTVTIEAGGQLEIKADINEPLVKINGKVVAEGAVEGTYAIINDASAATNSTGVFVSGSIVLNKGAKIIGTSDEAGNIVILSGGSIEITKKNSNVSMIENQAIAMAEGVTFTMNGYAKNVCLTAYTGSDKYYQTSEIIISNDDSNHAKNTSSITVKTVVEKNQAVYGEFTGDGFTQENETSKVTMKNYIMDVSGTLRGGDAIAAQGGNNRYGDLTNLGSYYGVDSDGNAIESKKILPTISISGDLAVDATGSIEVNGNALMTVSGNVAVEYDDEAVSPGTITIGGNLYVTGNVTFNYNSLTASSGKVTVDGGLMTVTGYDETVPKVGGLYAAFYTVENVAASTSVTYFCDLKDAIAGAVAAGSDEVVVYAGKDSQTKDTAKEALKAGAYIVEDGTVIPDGITLRTMNALYVPENATLTFEVGSSHDTSDWGSKYIFVLGKVIDNDDILTADEICYEVSKYNEDTNVRVYTTLTIALSEAVSGEVITLANDAKVDSTVTIASGVTVNVGDADTSDVELTIKEKGELIVNGILNINGSVSVVKNGNAVGKITVNNIVMMSDEDDITLDDQTPVSDADESSRSGSSSDESLYLAGFYTSGKIGELESDHFILAPAVAAANSATLEDMTVEAKTTYSGDLVFNAAEDATDVTKITIDAEAVFGKITLSGYSVIVGSGKLTATVGADVTAGHSAVKLDKVTSALTVKVDSQDSGEAVTTTFVISQPEADSGAVLAGKLTIAEGQVYLTSHLVVGTYTEASKNTDSLTVASGAELIMIDGKMLTLDTNTKSNGLIIDGTLTVNKGTIENGGKILVNGTLAVNCDQTFEGVVTVLGTLAIANSDDNKAIVTVSGSMIVGAASKTLGAAAAVTGALNVTGKLSVYPGADMSGALINVNPETGESSACKLELLINGQLYMTGYSVTGSTPVSDFIPATVKLTGYEDIAAANWYLNEGLTTAVGENTVADYSKAYAKAVLKTADVQVSVGKGMSVYIDNVRYSNGQTATGLTVGEHTVAVTVDPGYTGTTSILFNGAAVNNGVFTITADMANQTVVLSVTGDITVNPGTVTTEDNGGNGLTDILLVVLVVLIAVMAIMVALRMMRS